MTDSCLLLLRTREAVLDVHEQIQILAQNTIIIKIRHLTLDEVNKFEMISRKRLLCYVPNLNLFVVPREDVIRTFCQVIETK